MNVKLDQKKIEQAIGLYRKGMTHQEIADLFGVSRVCILNALKRNGIQSRPSGERKFFFDENFFEKIDSEEKAYWLGFIYADGSVNHKTYSLEIELSSIDKDHLRKLASIIKYDGEIDETRQGKACRIRLHSRKLALDLRNLGVVKSKSDRLVEPVLDESLRIHFWRGVFDGDGWFGISDRKSVGFASISKAFSEAFKHFVEKKSEASKATVLQRKQKSGKIMYQIVFEGTMQIESVKDFYIDAKVFLDRKNLSAKSSVYR